MGSDRFSSLLMGKFWREMKHAFAVTPCAKPQDDELPPHLERLARSVVERGMATPVLIFLETARPLSFLTGQSMLAAWPLVKLFTKTDDFERVAVSLEDRRTIRRFTARVEELATRFEDSK